MRFADIANFVLDGAEIPETALEMAALLLVDTLGVAAGAAGLAAHRIATDHAFRFHAAGDRGDSARLLFDGRRASISGAAFAAATAIDNLDAHDGYNPTKGHIGCAVVPALFAFAEARPDLTGREALSAMVMAYEVATRAALALHGTVADYHTSGAWNALGVAALGCRLRGARASQLREAFGIAEYHGPRSQMMREIANPSMLHDGSGMGALVGSMAALLAEDGFSGAPAITLEAAEAAPYWRDLGQDFTIERNYIKPYPICRWAHAALDALALLKRRQGFSPQEVARIDVATFTEAARLFRGRPGTTSEAQYSLPFALAVLLLRDRITPGDISGNGLDDPALEGVLPIIHVREDKRHSARFPEARWSDVTITLQDGRRLSSGDVHAKGGPEAPMSLAETEEKFRIMTGALPTARANAIWSMRRELLAPDCLFSDLAALVTPPAG